MRSGAAEETNMTRIPEIGGITPLIPAGADLDAAIAFYVEKLGFEQTWRDGDMGGVRRGKAEILLYVHADAYLASQTSFRIQVTNVAALFAEYQAQGVIHPNGTLQSKPWGTQEFAVLDPAGVCIAFWERPAA